MTEGLLGALGARLVEPAHDPELPAADVDVAWAGRAVRVAVRPVIAAEPVPRAITPGEVTVARGAAWHPPARRSPSKTEPIPCTVGTPVILGARLPFRGAPDMEQLGNAMHAFLAVDRPTSIERAADARLAVATDLVQRHGVDANIDPATLVCAGDRLWAWLERELAPLAIRCEVPVVHRPADRTLVSGTADLVARTLAGLVLIDHKTFPGTDAQALARIAKYSGQLATYAAALTAATDQPTVATLIHLPMLGMIVPVTPLGAGER